MGRQDFETETLLAVGGFPSSDTTHTLRGDGFDASAVRRLTPMECERLQGFPDDYTRIDTKTADGTRYKSLGNSMAVPVMCWIGQRIHAVDKLLKGEPPCQRS
jgi:site-specific DNA-cytosine methylase